jgi:hypothetical protein
VTIKHSKDLDKKVKDVDPIYIQTISFLPLDIFYELIKNKHMQDSKTRWNGYAKGPGNISARTRSDLL